jgi:hypothetical protein
VDGIEQVSQEENDLLTRPFTMDKIREVIFQMEYNKAPGPDGFPTEFYQSCWEIVKNDFMALFQEFHNGNLPLYNLNFGQNFQTKKGARQGDPLSPILFNIVVDMLAILIKRAKEEGQITGVIPHMVDDGLLILQYADDTILFMEHDINMAKNMKLLLSAFEQLSGLKINFHKSKIFCFSQAKDYKLQYE